MVYKQICCLSVILKFHVGVSRKNGFKSHLWQVGMGGGAELIKKIKVDKHRVLGNISLMFLEGWSSPCKWSCSSVSSSFS
jgi:hypothetical protein